MAETKLESDVLKSDCKIGSCFASETLERASIGMLIQSYKFSIKLIRLKFPESEKVTEQCSGTIAVFLEFLFCFAKFTP